MKVHRARVLPGISNILNKTVYFYLAVCGAREPDTLTRRWINVTCKKCLKMKGKK